jgi:hypothetical protein
MDTSRNLMASIDLQNGVFEEDGMRLLEEWEKSGTFLSAPPPVRGATKVEPGLDLNQPRPEILKEEVRAANKYDNLFD